MNEWNDDDLVAEPLIDEYEIIDNPHGKGKVVARMDPNALPLHVGEPVEVRKAQGNGFTWIVPTKLLDGGIIAQYSYPGRWKKIGEQWYISAKVDQLERGRLWVINRDHEAKQVSVDANDIVEDADYPGWGTAPVIQETKVKSNVF